LTIQEFLDAFYDLLAGLRAKCPGGRNLTFTAISNPITRASLPTRGVYLFFEKGELRASPHQSTQRVVRIGTHATTRDAPTLLIRLGKHIGSMSTSVFRRHMLEAMTAAKPGLEKAALIASLTPYLSSNMSFLLLSIDPMRLRTIVEKWLIGLGSHCLAPVDGPSANWLGLHHPSVLVRNSGLWNKNYVNLLCGSPVPKGGRSLTWEDFEESPDEYLKDDNVDDPLRWLLDRIRDAVNSFPDISKNEP
jgi:hypothetical protein